MRGRGPSPIKSPVGKILWFSREGGGGSAKHSSKSTLTRGVCGGKEVPHRNNFRSKTKGGGMWCPGREESITDTTPFDPTKSISTWKFFQNFAGFRGTLSLTLYNFEG